MEILPFILFFTCSLALTQASQLFCLQDESVSRVPVHKPLVISTWPFVEAVEMAKAAVEGGASALDAVVDGCTTCENLRCDGSVGYGGSPDENGETTLDAMVMDGTTMNVGAVGALRSVKEAIRAAKLVLEYTEHTLLVGDQASAFAVSLGLPGPVNLSTTDSMQKWSTWRKHRCQPNFWENVLPDCHTSCGPYRPCQDKSSPLELGDCSCDCWKRMLGGGMSTMKGIGRRSHDTISMAVIDKDGRIAVGTSTNGATFKIPGRVGDGPIVGAAAYADDDVGACGATGDGDIMMRFLPCYQVVESMRLGLEPQLAANDAISRIRRKYPSFIGALFAINKDGVHAGAAHGWTFQYSFWSSGMAKVKIFTVFPEVF
ncbi:hypothetical protein O6H91_Y048000 [Diphasiastrum complanatum]|nr:hypothetical protein O6H91_Y048000 [Diphasiastrum complanatum]